MKKPLLVLTSLLLLVLLVLPTLAAAQPKPGPPSPQIQQVLQNAMKKYQAGELTGAIGLLEPLNKPGVHPAVLSLLGTLYLESGRPKEALALLGPLAETGTAGPLILSGAGRAAFALGQNATAEKYLRSAVAKEPDSLASRDLGLVLGSQGRLAESYVLLRPWTTAHPEDAEARLSAAYDALELDRAPEAAELLKGLPADNPRVRLLQGRFLLTQQKPREGLATLEPLLKDGPPALDLSVRRYLAEGHVALGESSAAIELLKGKVGDDPSLAVLLGRAYYRNGNPTEAIAVLEPFARTLLVGAPASPGEQSLMADLAFEYGQALVAASKWPEAIKALDRATQLNPASLQGWQLLGRAQLASGQKEDANRSMEKVRQLQSAQPSNTSRMNAQQSADTDPTGRNLAAATALANSGHLDQALAMVRQEAKLQPADPRPHATEVVLLISAKRPQDALKAAEAALSTAPGNPDYVYLRGAARMALKDLPGAEQDFRQALTIKPDHVGALSDLAVLLSSTGKKDEARQLLQKVLAIRPGDPVATANLKSLNGAP
ncbi:MAG TPA: tetratricopeptide repeat protein [Thermoanaerobaculia bacterium]|nr:tetratricopeptide repeat protein [Thermoanaerobaculia bacterium]